MYVYCFIHYYVLVIVFYSPFRLFPLKVISMNPVTGGEASEVLVIWTTPAPPPLSSFKVADELELDVCPFVTWVENVVI